MKDERELQDCDENDGQESSDKCEIDRGGTVFVLALRTNSYTTPSVPHRLRADAVDGLVEQAFEGGRGDGQESGHQNG
ncbi:hypothetical protein GCM10027403_05690 [Arthrobacter tecti]